ncbi:hypothetical protein JTM46_35050, partial [Pseudomonas aeruginosa]|nr:hypothetical protein [Pseudomonas aeruginosa]
AQIKLEENPQKQNKPSLLQKEDHEPINSNTNRLFFNPRESNRTPTPISYILGYHNYQHTTATRRQLYKLNIGPQ